MTTPSLPAAVMSYQDALAELEREHALDATTTERVAEASQWTLMWWRFRKNKLALVAVGLLALFFSTALLAEPFAPYLPDDTASAYTYAPPQQLHVWDANGLTRPYVYALDSTVDAEALRRVFVPNPEERIELGFFVRGEPYRWLGLIESDLRLFGPLDPDQRVYLLGADRLGQDLLSRLIYATRISMSIGLVSIVFSLTLGIVIGGISGYFGGRIDLFIQRLMEFIDAIPSIPLWMGLSAAIPLTWDPLLTYFAITLILALLRWIGTARVVRGKFLALREEDFVMAARVAGASEARIIFRHMLPSFISHLIAGLTLSIPGAILAETSLSFLGLGLRPPIESYGILLQEATNLRTVAQAPWLMVPAVFVIVVVIAYNCLGDGLRDAADPYA